MYIPPRFQAKDQSQILDIIRQYPFAILISNEGGQTQATHIPILLEENTDGKLYLRCHLAAANPQSHYFLQSNHKEVLAIFQGPHAYISPSLYNHPNNVPTWNFVAAHVYGILRVVEAPDAQLEILEKTIQLLESSYLEQWAQLPEAYIEALRKEITAIEIEVTKLEGKTKLSQNKTAEEQQRIATKLCNSDNTVEQDLGKWMQENIDHH